ncbi:MAG: thiamine pyrophosphate-requiring protein [Halodesulfurarchaeum sp.]
MNVTNPVAEILREEGVEYLFGFPSNPLFDTDAAEAAGIRSIVVRQERTGVHMADAVGRMTSGEEIAAFACQHGPGAENAVGGIAQAYSESAPLVAIPAGYGRSKTDTDPKWNSLINYGNVSKSYEQLTDPDAVTETMRRAFSNARNGRPRPSTVEIPLDVWDEDVGTPEYTPSKTSAVGPDRSAVDEAVEVLLEAENPMIHAGQGVHYARAWDELLEFAELLEIPVATSLTGKSAFPETHPLSLGAGSKSEPGHLSHFVHESDVIFGIGCSFTETSYGITVPEDTTVVHSTLDQTDIDKDVEADYPVLGDAKVTLEAMIDVADDRLDGPRGRFENVAAEIETVKGDWLEEWMPKLTDDSTPINPYRVVHELNRIVEKENVIATHDAGNARDFMAPFFETIEPLSYIGWGKTTQLGYGLGLIMGAKLVHPEKLAINVWGDGAIGMTGLDFETAVREDIPILSILLNNYEMAGYDTPFGGDFSPMAEGLGGYSEKIEDPDEVADAIERGIEKTEDGTPVLLEFITSTETDLSRPYRQYR